MKKRMKGDNLVLTILIIVIIAVALLAGVSYGYEFRRKKCNAYYSNFIRNNCMCSIPVNSYESERFIPTTVLNLSVNVS